MAAPRRPGTFTSLPLNPRSAVPLYRQVYERVRVAILEGHLPAGTMLPSTRSLAQSLGLSRNTVMLAYEQLTAEGYLEGITGAGTFVCRSLPERFFETGAARGRAASASPDRAALSRRGEVLAGGPETLGERARVPCAFERVLPALDAFPVAAWRKLTARRWRDRPIELMGYGDPAGHGALREAIAAHLGTTRAVRCTPDQVVIVPGHLDLIARVLLDPGDPVWVEEPGYPGFRKTLLGAGARLIPVPVDGEGLVVHAGEALCPSARMAHVTPSHQYPLGMTMSLPRRLALLEWARRSGAWVVEDDYGSEFRFHGRPLESLQGLDRHGRVIYLGSLSRVLFPALRASYVVVPPGLIDACLAARAALFGPQNIFEQAVAADFINEGHFVRHLRRMRALYAERQGALLRAAGRDLGGLLDVPPADGGMFLVGWLPAGVDDRAASQHALRQGVVADPLSPLYQGPDRRAALLLGYASIGPSCIREGVRRLRDALRGVPTPRG